MVTLETTALKPKTHSAANTENGGNKDHRNSGEFSDPLTLHHSDHSGMVLVSKLLKCHNYGSGAVS